MCGIAGFVDGAARRSPGENDRLARAMGDSIRHRGPDAGAVWSDPQAGIWLSHRRLAIVDLTEAGAQPMATPDGRGVLCYNGEAYNAAELRPELEAAGYRFRGHSDTEVILYGLRHWGVRGTLDRLIGFFAFAYWDGEARRLTLAVDRLGKKPLYWTRHSGGMAFASEMRPLMLHPDCPRAIDRASVAEYLRTLYVPAPNSILAGVGKLEPGTILTYDPGREAVSTEAYWSVREAATVASANPFRGSLDDAAEEADALLRDATRLRLVSDVPLGAFLSGGIDSSTIVAMMQQVGSSAARTFSIGYADADYNEADDAEQVARHLGTEHQSFILSAGDALAVIPQLPDIFDEPFADASQIPTYMVSKLARAHVTVALTGDGGDEVFGGYNRHVAAAGLLRRLSSLPMPLRKGLAGAIGSLSPDAWQRLFSALPARRRPRAVGEKLHKLAPLLPLDGREQYRRVISYWDEPERVAVGGRERPGPIDAALPAGLFPDAVSEMRYLDLVTYLPGDILTKVDRASMAVSLETRAPLLDHRLVEFSFRIPSSLHVSGGKGKRVLRRVLERYVPRELFERPKTGFGVPIGDWLRGPLRGWADDLLSPGSLAAGGLVDPEPVRRAWRRHLAGEVNAQYQLWAVLMLVAWCREHCADAGEAPPLAAAC